MLEEEDAEEFAAQLTGATMRVVREYDGEDVVGEPAFSDQLCGRLKEALEDFETPTIRWQADVALQFRELRGYQEKDQQQEGDIRH